MMSAHPTNPHHRRSIRLPGYDYTQAGAYFVTLVTQGREAVFGEIVNGQMRLNAAGKIVEREWERLPQRFPYIQLDAFVIMPNHVHAVILINDDRIRATQVGVSDVGATRQSPLSATAGDESLPTGALVGNEGSPRRMADGFVQCEQAEIVVGDVGATRQNPLSATAGDESLPTGALVGNEGSPRRMADGFVQCGQAEIVVGDVGATRQNPLSATTGNESLPTGAPVGNEGSPLPMTDGSPRQRQDEIVVGDVGATRQSLLSATAGNESLPTGAPVGDDGSPLPAVDGSPRRPNGPPTGSLGAVIGQFKSRITKQIWRSPDWKGVPIWQRNYFEHIIRNDREHQRITLYIDGNPAQWADDDENPAKKP